MSLKEKLEATRALSAARVPPDKRAIMQRATADLRAAVVLQQGGVFSYLAAEEGRTLRALGASPAMTIGDGLMGTIVSIVIGSLLAVVVALGLSPLAPIGVVRPVYPDPGIAFDWGVSLVEKWRTYFIWFHLL